MRPEPYDVKMDDIFKDITAKEVARQAEFGMEPSWEDFVIAGREAGIKEVVEWFEQNINYKNSSIREWDKWQTKLKEWKI